MVPPPSRLRQGRQPKAALCKRRQQKESADEIRRGVSRIKCCANSEVAALGASSGSAPTREMKVKGWDPAGWSILEGRGGADMSQRERGGAPDHQGPLLKGIRLWPTGWRGGLAAQKHSRPPDSYLHVRLRCPSSVLAAQGGRLGRQGSEKWALPIVSVGETFAFWG